MDDGLMTLVAERRLVQLREGVNRLWLAASTGQKVCAAQQAHGPDVACRAYKLRDTLAGLTRWNLVKSKRMRTMIW